MLQIPNSITYRGQTSRAQCRKGPRKSCLKTLAQSSIALRSGDRDRSRLLRPRSAKWPSKSWDLSMKTTSNSIIPPAKMNFTLDSPKWVRGSKFRLRERRNGSLITRNPPTDRHKSRQQYNRCRGIAARQLWHFSKTALVGVANTLTVTKKAPKVWLLGPYRHLQRPPQRE